MNKIPCIIYPFGNAQALWFNNSGTFLLLEAPAFEVFENYNNNKPVTEIKKVVAKKYGQLEKNIEQFVDEVIHLINYYNSKASKIDYSQKEFINEFTEPDEFYSTKHYRFNDKTVEINYQTQLLESTTHPLFEHLQTKNIKDCQHRISCFQHKNNYLLTYNGELVEAFKTTQPEYFTASIKQQLFSLMYNTGFKKWMAMLHASGVSKNNRAILFSAAAGSGKSTMAALLSRQGYRFVSDDIVAASIDGKAFAFPAAISVKPGSEKVLAPYYPELKNQEFQQSFIGKTIKYLPVKNGSKNAETGNRVIAFIFIQFSSSEDFSFSEMNKTTALQLLLKETWVNKTPEFVEAFFNWVNNTPFYTLRYSNTSDAIGVIKRIFRDKD